MSRWTIPAWLLLGVAVAACGGAPAQPSSDLEEPSLRSDATASVGAPAPAPASDERGPAPDGEDLAALVELLTPPGGVETERIVNEGATLLRWVTPESIESVNAHYEGLADGLAFVYIGIGAGGKSWVFEASEAAVASGSVQVAPMADETAVTVTLDAEVGE